MYTINTTYIYKIYNVYIYIHRIRQADINVIVYITIISQ